MDTDNKVFVVKNEVLTSKDHIIMVIAHGEQTDEVAWKHERHFADIINCTDVIIRYLIDLNDCGKNSPKAREMWLKLSEDERTGKVALFGIHPVAHLLASFVMRLTSKNNMKFFKKREQALAWLRAED